MNRLDLIRAELKAEEATLVGSAESVEDPHFEVDLAQALHETEPTDGLIEALAALSGIASPVAVVSKVTVTAPAPVLDLATIRVQQGISVDSAARMLDMSRDAFDRLESKAGMGWTNLTPSLVRGYLDRLGIKPTQMVRAIANQLPQGTSYAYGYRPRMVAEEALAIEPSDKDRERLVAWAHELYRT
jgi:hypothetical protein